MPAPTTTAELLTRARTALTQDIRYRLGRGGRRPNDATPAQENQCDCSGYIAWCLGFDRFIRNPFYARINGEAGSDRGWFETSAAHQDAQATTGILRQLSAPVPGAIAVYPDSNGREGHIGIVTQVRDGRPTHIIHCASSHPARRAVQENAGTPFINNRNTIYAWYDGILDAPDERSTRKRTPLGLAAAAPANAGTGATKRARALAAAPADGDGGGGASGRRAATTANEELTLLYAPRDNQGNILYKIYKDASNTVVWQARAHICADGCPEAYHPNNTGLDSLKAAGKPPRTGADDHCRWDWWGITTRPNGCPYVQTRSHPFPGYYVSTTALVDGRHAESDPARFVDANTVPYLVMPLGRYAPAQKGDYGYIIHRPSGRGVPVIFAELGPGDETGELSMEAARRLRLDPNPRNGGSERRDFLYLTFSGSKDSGRWNVATIARKATALFEQWGGMARVGRTPAL